MQCPKPPTHDDASSDQCCLNRKRGTRPRSSENCFPKRELEGNKKTMQRMAPTEKMDQKHAAVYAPSANYIVTRVLSYKPTSQTNSGHHRCVVLPGWEELGHLGSLVSSCCGLVHTGNLCALKFRYCTNLYYMKPCFAGKSTYIAFT